MVRRPDPKRPDQIRPIQSGTVRRVDPLDALWDTYRRLNGSLSSMSRDARREVRKQAVDDALHAHYGEPRARRALDRREPKRFPDQR